MTTSLYNQFIEKYGSSDRPVRTFFAPGRVNLIGDHTDYNGGLVFPCAIDQGNTMLIRATNDDTFKLASTNFDLIAALSRDQTHQKYGDHWINYPLGVMQQFTQDDIHLQGFECLYSGNVPNAAGLSSSASIEVVTAFALNELFDLNYDLLSLVKLAQRAENEFVGVQCGIMDQFAVAMGQSGHAMKLDCETLDCEQVPLPAGDHDIILVNTNQRRELSESHYNQRVTETREALSLLVDALGDEGKDYTQLCEVSVEQLETHKAIFDRQPVIYQRARHVTSEHQRVIDAVSALRANDMAAFGQLMHESHTSLRQDYAVSSKPLDALVDIAMSIDGVLGSRLTGAGFGGCTVNLVHRSVTQQFKEITAERYQNDTGLSADFYVIRPSTGVREITE